VPRKRTPVEVAPERAGPIPEAVREEIGARLGYLSKIQNSITLHKGKDFPLTHANHSDDP
jgi:hypothetical protein